MALMALPSTGASRILYLNRDRISIHSISHNESGLVDAKAEDMETFYGVHFTCLYSSPDVMFIGMTSHLGVQAEYKVCPVMS